jgi:hypothetical protein
LFNVKFDPNKLLFLAWEDPENEDAIPDYFDDEIDEKNEMQERIIDQLVLLTSKLEKIKKQAPVCDAEIEVSEDDQKGTLFGIKMKFNDK